MNDIDKSFIILKYGLLSNHRHYGESELRDRYLSIPLDKTLTKYHEEYKKQNIHTPEAMIPIFNKLLIEELCEYESMQKENMID